MNLYEPMSDEDKQVFSGKMVACPRKGHFISFQLVDEVLPANNGLYSLCSGQLTIQPSSVSSEVPSVTIQQLTQALLGYHIENLPALFAEFPSNKPYIDAFLNS